jgi:hypothetical protein
MDAAEDFGKSVFVALTARVWTLHLFCAACSRFGRLCSRYRRISLLRSMAPAYLSLGKPAIAERSGSGNRGDLPSQPTEMVCPSLCCRDSCVLVLRGFE